MQKVLLTLFITSFALMAIAREKTFIGSEVCGSCHPDEYENYLKYAKKAHSFDNIQKLRETLTKQEYESCLQCHTTGYGLEGGFVDEEKTPHLKNPGCEVCHGPGSLHIETMSKDDIIYQVDVESCKTCHNSERIASFLNTPLKYGGAH